MDGAWDNEAFAPDFALELRVRFSTEPAKDQAQSEEFWRIVNTKHDQSHLQKLEDTVFHIAEDGEVSEDESEEDLLDAAAQQKIQDELKKTSDLLGAVENESNFTRKPTC